MEYLKISSGVGGSHNNCLERSIICIGEHRAILKEWRKERIEEHYAALRNLNEAERNKNKKKNFKHGKKIIAKHSRASVTAIHKMVESDKIKDSDNRKWYFHKRIYAEAFESIEYLFSKLLKKCPPSDKDILIGHLNAFYLKICEESEIGDKLERLYSNALLFWQKNMLRVHEIKPYVKDKEIAGEILKRIIDVDKPLP